MDVEALKDAFRAVGITPVHVKGGAFPNDDREPEALGSLEDYIEALKALRSPIVLIYTSALEPESFLYISDEDEETDEDGEVLDLCSENPELARFKKYIGQIGLFKLSAPMQSERLNYFFHEDWYKDFSVCWRTAVDGIEDKRIASLAIADAEESAKHAELLASLHALIDDRRFGRLPTQKAMLAYALDKIPGLEEMDETVVKREIQNLRAKIVAKLI